MRRSTVLSLNRIKIFSSLSRNKLLLLLFFIFALGIVLGVVTFLKSETAVSLSQNLFLKFIKARTDKSFFSVLISSFAASMLMLLVSFLFGASVMGVVVTPLYVCVLGFCYGSVSAFMYSQYAISGVAFNAVVFIPATAVLFVSLIFASRNSINFSFSLAKLTLTNSINKTLFEDFKKYCSSYFVITAIIFCSSVIDSILSKTLFKFFDF